MMTNYSKYLCIYLLSFAHGAHRLSMVSDMSSVPRADTADRGTADQAVEAA